MPVVTDEKLSSDETFQLFDLSISVSMVMSRWMAIFPKPGTR